MDINFTKVYHNVPNPKDKIDEVEANSGIYGWYYNFEALKNFTNNPRKLKSELLKISEKLKNPEFNAILNAKFGNNFKGTVEHNSKFKKTDIDERIDSLSEDELKQMLSILQNFTQPLYIGIAKNLKDRYSTHFDSILANICIADKRKGKCFGHRIQERKIEIRELVYKYQVLDMDRANIEKIEFIANRFFKPIFGRR